MREVIESDGKHTVVDLHLWSLGSGISSGIISIVSSDPQTTNYYKEKINEVAELQHIPLSCIVIMATTTRQLQSIFKYLDKNASKHRFFVPF